jgi:hypothetical protein
MTFERTTYGVLIGDKCFTYLSAREALDLLHWLAQQRDALVRASQMEPREHPEPEYKEPKDEWIAAEIAEMISEDEQIARCDF